MNTSLFNLSGRVALITGSSRGIGADIALAFSEAGADVAIHCSGNTDLAKTVAEKAMSIGSKTVVISENLSEEGAAKRVLDQTIAALGKVDIFVLNASSQIPENWLNITKEDFENQVTVNYRASLEFLQGVVPHMTSNHWGRILSIGSVQEKKPHPDMLVYSSLKNAQTGMIVSLAKQIAPHGITANNLAPGVILTDRNINRLDDKSYAQDVMTRIPIGRFGETKDCVGAALLLCSEAGGYITGQTLFVDGGMSL